MVFICLFVKNFQRSLTTPIWPQMLVLDPFLPLSGTSQHHSLMVWLLWFSDFLFLSSFPISAGVCSFWYFPKKVSKFLSLLRILMAFLHCLPVSSIAVDKPGAIFFPVPLNVNLKEIITRNFKISFYSWCSRIFKWFALVCPLPPSLWMTSWGPPLFMENSHPSVLNNFCIFPLFPHHATLVFPFWIRGGCWTSKVIPYLFSLLFVSFYSNYSRFLWLYHPIPHWNLHLGYFYFYELFLVTYCIPFHRFDLFPQMQ